MPLIETESLILRSYALAEADKIVVFLTRENGLIKGVAKGAKRLKSRFGGSLEPYTVVNLSYFQKEERELVTISNIDMVRSYFTEAVNPEFLQKFAYLAELLIEFAPPNEPNEKLYRMACVCLEAGSRDSGNLESVALYFELWILRLAGFLPNWKICFNCDRLIGDDENTNLQINFHLICQNCTKSGNRWNLTPQERNIFLVAQTMSPENFLELTREKTTQVREVSQILKKIISHVLGKETVGERILSANL